jgi:CheY-like chemotaxis protein
MTPRSAPRVLIVDDNRSLRLAFARVLLLEGYDVATAANAEEALGDICERPPDAIVLDWRMPIVNGVGLLYRLRQLESTRRVPVAVVTGDTSLTEDVRAELQELGAVVRFKPLAMDDLISVTRSMLQGVQV